MVIGRASSETDHLNSFQFKMQLLHEMASQKGCK